MPLSFATADTTLDTDTFTPKVRWDLRFRNADGTVCLETDDYQICVIGVEAVHAERIIQAIDGKKTVHDIAKTAGQSVDLTAAFIGRLFEHQLVFDGLRNGCSVVTSQTLFDTCRRVYPDWKSRLFSHPLWVQLATGDASPTVFMGWLMESYHFIEGANDRMPLAVSESTNHCIRAVLAHHYVEEWDHGGFFLKSLNELGISSQAVALARPLPSTIEVLNYMRRCARLGPIYYAVCSGFLESTGTDRSDAREFYRRLTANYAQHNPKIVKPMADHTDLDEAYGHGDILEQMMEHVDPMSEAEASRILEAGSLFVELLELWSGDILKTYGRVGAQVRSASEPYRLAKFCGE